MAARRRVTTNRVIYARRPAMPGAKKGKGVDSGVGKVVFKVALAGLAAFGLWRVFAVSQVAVSGNSVIPTSEIQREIEQSFSRHPFSKNLLTLWMASIEDDLLSDQRISSAAISLRWPNRLNVRVSERQLSLIWQSGSNQYLVDNKGVAVAEATGARPSLALIIDTTSLPVKVGSRVAPQSFVIFVAGIAEKITPKTGLAVTSMSIPETTSELDVKTTGGYVVKFDTTGGVEEQISSLKTVLTTLSRIQKKPAQYIDLRVPGKAYYL